MKIFRRFADSSDPDSLAARLRSKRFELFQSLVKSLRRPITILDVGGTQIFWEMIGFIEEPGVRIHILNIDPVKADHPNVTSSIGDARDMAQFEDDEFDIVFSNSVIEHVGGYEQQRKMANELQRVGKRYFVQTPNRFFPIEPHFLFPFFQFLPKRVRVFLVRHFTIGWAGPTRDRSKAEQRAVAINLISKSELLALFPGASLYREEVFGLAKSFIVYNDWK
jgi:hypothetical protein